MKGEELAGLMRRARITGRELAERVGTSRSNIAAMTAGHNSVDPRVAEYVRRLADAVERAIERVPVPELTDRRYTRDYD